MPDRVKRSRWVTGSGVPRYDKHQQKEVDRIRGSFYNFFRGARIPGAK